MTSIRILLAEMPNVLRTIVRHALDQEPDMRVVAEDVPAGSLASVVVRTEAEVVILRDTQASPIGDYRDLLFARPRTKFVAISESGEEAMISELRFTRSRISDLSPGSLVSVIRAASRAMEG